MLLSVLRPEDKENFLSLVYQIAKIDGEYSEIEKEIIENYKLKLGLPYIRLDKTIPKLIDYFANKDISLKKVVLFEAYALIISDDKLDKKESELLSLIEGKFAVDQDTDKAIKTAVVERKKLYDRIYEILA